MQIRVPRGLRVDLCGMQKTSRNLRTIHVFSERAKLQFRHLRLYTSRAPELNTTHRVLMPRDDIAKIVERACQKVVGSYH